MIEFIYITASLASVCAMAPQVKQVLITKRTDELSLTSWVIWAVAQAGTTIYALSVNAPPFIVISSVWALYYAAMVTLILHYRRTGPALLTVAIPATTGEPLSQIDSSASRS